MKFTVGLFLYVIFPFLSFADETLCLDADRAAKMQEIFKINLEKKPNLCNPRGFTYKALEALFFIEDLKFNNKKLPAPWDQNITGSSWIEYLQNLSPHIEEGGTTCAYSTGLMAYVKRGTSKVMYLCSAVRGVGVAELAETMMHEARHHEGHRHVDCTQGNMKDISGACDQNILDRGSYAVSVEINSNIAMRATNVHPSFKRFAMAEAISTTRNRFNVFNSKPNYYAIAIGEDDQIYKFDGENVKQLPLLMPAGNVYVRDMNEVAIIPWNKNVFASVFKTIDSNYFHAIQNLGSFVKDYNQQSGLDRTNLRDIIYHSGSGLTVRAFTSRIEVYYRNEKKEIEFIEGEIQRVFLPSDLGLKENSTVYVLTTDLRLFKVRTGAIFGESSIELVNNPNPEVIRIVDFNNTKYALSRQGDILEQLNGKYVPVENLKGFKFKELSRSLESFEEFDQMAEKMENSFKVNSKGRIK